MINFSSIPQSSLIGKILRGILKFIPKNAVLPILQGKLRGKKWIIGSGVFGYWLGDYEFEEQKFFEKIIKKNDIIFDIGAQAGFYTLLASELVGEKGKVFSFEPFPRNISYLKKNIAINNYRNIEVIEAVVTENTGILKFKKGENNFTGQIDENGELEVKAVSIDDLVNKGILSIPNIIKIDVEGAELLVLKGAAYILKKYKPAIFLSIHIFNDKIHKDCCDFLKNAGYSLKSIAGDNIKGVNEIFAYKNDK